MYCFHFFVVMLRKPLHHHENETDTLSGCLPRAACVASHYMMSKYTTRGNRFSLLWELLFLAVGIAFPCCGNCLLQNMPK